MRLHVAPSRSIFRMTNTVAGPFNPAYLSFILQLGNCNYYSAIVIHHVLLTLWRWSSWQNKNKENNVSCNVILGTVTENYIWSESIKASSPATHLAPLMWTRYNIFTCEQFTLRQVVHEYLYFMNVFDFGSHIYGRLDNTPILFQLDLPGVSHWKQSDMF